MSKTIDQRVVEMRFDNAQFEKNISTSMGTLEKLKTALKLDGATKGLDMVSARASKGVNLESIANSVGYLEKRFSTMGIVGMEVIRKLTDAAINFSTGVMRSVGDSIISGGIRRAQNIENAHFQLQGLLKDEEQVQAIMADAMDSVDGTAYAYDEAAKAASMFAASGLKAGEQMQTSLKAITGVAAVTNANYSDIAYIFTQIAGKGRIMGEDLNQFANRGMNAAATLAKYYREVKGEVDMTEQGIRDLISSKDTNVYFEEFAAAMNWAFGDQAKKANETFNGALSNIKAALARIGAKFVSPLLVQNGEFVQLFNEIRKRVNDINSYMDPFAQKFTGIVKGMAASLTDYLSNFDRQQEIMQTMPKLYRIFSNSIETARHVLQGFGSIIKPIIQGLTRFMPHDLLGRIADFTASLNKVTKGFKISDETAENLRHTFQGISAVIHMIGKAIMFVAEPVLRLAGNILPKLASGILAVTGPIGQGLVKIDLFFGNIGNGLKKLQSSLGITLPKMSDFISESQKLRFFTAIGTIIAKVKNTFSEFGAEVKKVFDQIKGKALEKFGQGLQGVLDIIKSSGASVVEGFIQAVEKLSQMEFKIPIKAANIKDFFTNIGNVFATGAGTIGTILSKLSEKIGEYIAPSQKLIKDAKERFARLTGDISDSVDKKNPLREILGTINTGLLGVLIVRLTDFVKKLKEGSGSLKKSITGTLTEVKKTLEAYQKDLKANSILKIGAAIGILAGSMWVLSQIPVERLGPAGAALAGIGVAIGIFLKQISGSGTTEITYGKDGFLYKAANSFTKDVAPAVLAFAGAVFIISKAMENLEFENGNDLVARVLAMGGIFAALGWAADGLMNVSEEIQGREKAYLTAAAGVVLMSFAVGKISNAVATIGKLDYESAGQGILGVGVIMVGLVELLKNLEKIDTKKMLGAGASMSFMAAALTVLIIPITALGLLPFDTVVQGLTGVGIALLEFALVLNSLDGVDWKSMLAGGVAMTAMATALTILVVPITALGLIPFPAVAQGLGAVAVGLIAMTAALKVLSSSNAGGMLAAGAGMIMIAGAMNLLIAPITALGVLPWDNVAQGLKAFLIALGGMAGIGLIATAGAAGLVALGSAFLMIAGSIAVAGVGIGLIGAGLASLAAGLLALSAIGKTAAQNIVETIRIIGTGFMTMMPQFAASFASSVIEFGKVILEGISELAPLLSEAVTNVIIYALAGVVAAIPAIKESTLIMIDTMLTALVEYTPRIIDHFMTWLIQIIDGVAARIPELVHSIANFLSQFVTAIVNEIKNLDGSAVFDAMIDFGVIAGILTALGAMLPLIPPAALAVAGFGALMAELTVVLTALGALNSIPGLQELVGKGGGLLQAIGTALGQFVGGLVGGFAEGVTSALPQIGTDLSNFMTNVQPFINGMANVDADIVASVGSLAAAIVILTGAELLNGVANFFTKGGTKLGSFGKTLTELGPMLRDFGKTIEGIKPESVEAASRVVNMVVTLSNGLSRSGGLLDKILGKKQTLGELGNQLIPFGKSMKEYAKAVDGIKPEMVEGSVQAAQMIADLANKLPNSGGVLADLIGDNSLKDFAAALPAFGVNMKLYAKSVDGITPEMVEGSVQAAQMIVDICNKLPHTGGAIAQLLGDNKLTDFAASLAPFADGMVDYSTKMANFQMGVVEKSAAAVSMIVDFADRIPNSGGLASLWQGDNSIQQFGDMLGYLGDGIAAYSAAISGKVDLPTMQSTLIELNKLADFATKVSSLDSDALGSFAYDLEQMAATGVDGFIETFANSYDRATTAVNGLIDGVVAAIKAKLPGITTTGNSIGLEMCTGISTGIVTNTGSVITTVKTTCQTIITGFKDGLPVLTFNNFGSVTIITSIINGMTNKVPTLLSAIRTICAQIITTFRTGLPISTFQEIGRTVIQGLINGINDPGKKQELINACKKICEDVVNAIKGNMKGFEDIGKAIDDGMAKGIKDNAEVVAKALEDVVRTAIAKEKQKLGIKSPSRVMAEDGKYMALGLAKGISDYADRVVNATESVSDSALDSMRNAIRRISSLVDSEMDVQPTIAPVVDLTNIQNGAKQMRGILTKGISTSISYSKALNASTSAKAPDELSNSTDRTSTVSNSYNFTQNNYSPKALSRKEIYRQTKNQFSALKGAVSG